MNTILFFKKIIKRLKRVTNTCIATIKAPFLGVKFIKPDHLYLSRLDASSVVVDVGCGSDADFSVELIARHGVTSYVVDPTKKHRSSLCELEKKMNGHLIHIPVAVSAYDGELVFHESKENMSGSLIESHHNIQRDTVENYSVPSLTIASLLRKIGLSSANFLKLDLEGAEYDLIRNTGSSIFRSFDQICIEFHHHCIDSISFEETKDAVNRIRNMGFHVFSFDEINYLFYKA